MTSPKIHQAIRGAKREDARIVSRRVSEEMLACTVLTVVRVLASAAKLMAEIVSKPMLRGSGTKHDTVLTHLSC
jgi:hypothetical protein